MILFAFVACATVWVLAGRRAACYLLPVYLFTVALDAPFVPQVVVFPDLGLSALTEGAISVGDLLLLATVALWRPVRRELMAPLPIAFVLVSVIGCCLGLLAGRYPAESVIYLAAAPARLGLLVALFRASQHTDTQLRRALWLSIGAFLVPVMALLAASVVPQLEAVRVAVGLGTGTGRIAFPGLGNNKIGLALLLLCSSLCIVSRWHPARRIVVRRFPFQVPTLPLALVTAVVIATVAQLRFASTALLLLLGCYLMTRSRRLAIGGVVGGIAALAVLNFVSGQKVSVRAFSVLSGDFDLTEDSSFASRLALWDGAVTLWKQNPLLGAVGSWEWDRPITRPIFSIPIETHSEILWWLAEFGILGLLVLVVALVPVVRTALQAGFVAAVATGLAFVGLLLNAATFFPGTAACLAFLIAVPTMVAGRSSVNSGEVETSVRGDLSSSVE